MRTDNDLVVLARAGNQTAHAELYSRYANVIAKIQHRWGTKVPYNLYPEVMSNTNLGYLDCVETYNPDKGAFSTWLNKRCNYIMLDWIKKGTTQSRMGIEIYGMDIEAPEIDQRRWSINHAIEKLPTMERKVLEYRLQGFTGNEIAKRMKIKYRVVYDIGAKAIIRLRKTLTT